MSKIANSSQAAWALLTEGVTAARLESHRLRLLLSRALALVNKSPEKEHIQEIAGDIVQGVPGRLDALDRTLDRTAYALSLLGEDHLRERLPLADRHVVDEAMHKSKVLSVPMVRRVADRHLARMGAGCGEK